MTTPYIPVYKRSPNTFIRYEMRQFRDESRSGKIRVAIYRDKNGKIKEDVAQVIWE